MVVGLGQVLGVRGGPMGLVAIFAPHLLLGATVLALAALLRTRWAAGFVSLGIVLAAGMIALGPEWISVPSRNADGPTVRVMSWNLEFESRAVQSLSSVLGSTDADIVALQELTPEAAAAIEGDAAISGAFPYRILIPVPGVLGMGILSRIPMRELGRTEDPPTIAAEVDADGRTVRILNAHPLPAQIAALTELRVPIAIDPSDRDADLRTMRALADDLAASGVPVILIGDLNVAPTEPAYDDLVRGWRDAHAVVGVGPGWTWRPSRLQGLGIAMLRIDYVLVTPNLEPIDIRQDCSRPGDHCVVRADIGFLDP